MVGRSVGTYNLTEQLGQGGMGVVYKGFDPMIEREVAIKALRPEIAGQPEILERFRGEAIALARLNHPHIATLYSFFREGDEYFMVMEFVNGRTLESIIGDSGPLPPALAISIASQVLEAIDHAASQGILHRDIKPANVMVTPSAQVKVTDFGIARVLGNARLTREGCAYGTLEYLAPERIRGEEGDVRSDLYSLGVVLYEMLSHRLPFERSSEYELMRAHLEEEPPSLSGSGLSSIPPKLELVIAGSMAKRPEDRFSSAGQFRSALAAIDARQSGLSEGSPLNVPAHDPALASTPAVIAPASVRPAASGKLRWTLYAAAALVLAAGAIIGVLSRRHVSGAVNATPVSAQAPAAPMSHPVSPGQPDRNPQARRDLSSQPSTQTASQPSAAGTASETSAIASKAELRRRAALKALDESKSGASTAKKTTGSDRRSRALDALQN